MSAAKANEIVRDLAKDYSQGQVCAILTVALAMALRLRYGTGEEFYMKIIETRDMLLEAPTEEPR